MNIAMTGRTNTGRTTLDITLPTKKGKEQAEAITVYTAIPNMAESLKAIMHRRRKTGMSDTSTVYYSSWQSQTNNTDEAHSHTPIHD
jgi:hypothetical protein